VFSSIRNPIGFLLGVDPNQDYFYMAYLFQGDANELLVRGAPQ
jgi:hypothetical protein